MNSKNLLKRLERLEKKIEKMERNANKRIESLEDKLNSFRETDTFDNSIEISNKNYSLIAVILLLTIFRVVILGAAVVIPWDSIRDFWVKTSMCGFFIKSSKRFKKTWKKSEGKNQGPTELLLSLTESGHELLLEKEHTKV